MLKLVVPSLKGIGSDIKKEGVTELAYDRMPVPGGGHPAGAVEADPGSGSAR